MVDLFPYIPFLPLLGAATMLFLGRRLPKAGVYTVCVGVMGIAFAMALAAVMGLREQPGHIREITWYVWLPLMKADLGFLLDPLSAVMLLVITGIGFLIHIYSVGYMAHEGGTYRFFGYLNLFVFFMLLLVLANNFALLFVGWEGVGLCSYLLIGFYFHKKSAGDAGKKAFIVNRIGDAGFILGTFMVLSMTGTVRFTEVRTAMEKFPAETQVFGWISLASLLLFVGATGKSAQVPLYVWLPDAMEGPTPVSALIHAATMVTAGVYMVARSSAIFVLAPMTLSIILIVGAFTAIFAASIGLAQNDIKRVLAYSTVSQLGFMFMALGAGAWWVAIFHLMTHAFFKALLFLGSGSVIHGMGGEQDMRQMGGLKKYMPYTYWTMMIGTLAIAGIPGLSGFFSKDEILLNVYLVQPFVYGVGWLTALMTAFYMWRLMSLTFHGELRNHHVHPHESPKVMTLPLMLLAVGSALAGWPHAAFHHWLEPVFPHAAKHEISHTLEYGLMGLAVAAAALGIFLSRFQIRGAIESLLRNKWYVDEIYSALFVEGLCKGGGLLLGAFDRAVVDGGVNGVGFLTRLWSRWLIFWDTWVVDGAVRFTSFGVKVSSYPARLVQTGSVQTYALIFMLGLLAVLGVYVSRP